MAPTRPTSKKRKKKPRKEDDDASSSSASSSSSSSSTASSSTSPSPSPSTSALCRRWHTDPSSSIQLGASVRRIVPPQHRDDVPSHGRLVLPGIVAEGDKNGLSVRRRRRRGRRSSGQSQGQGEGTGRRRGGGGRTGGRDGEEGTLGPRKCGGAHPRAVPRHLRTTPRGG
mmetsp:Transcript_39679/g.119212  ORF Transcript_39679/g.119212 Transcript_39679/m.119212 type:complete len:170 (-) Transcript_39679:340-849(-)